MPDGSKFKIGERVTPAEFLIQKENQHMSTMLTDIEETIESLEDRLNKVEAVDTFLQQHGENMAEDAGLLEHGSQAEKFGALLRLRRKATKVKDAGYVGFRRVTKPIRAEKTLWSLSMQQRGFAGTARLALPLYGKAILRAANQYIGLGNAIGLAISTKAGRRVLGLLTRPVTWLGTKVADTLRKSEAGTWVMDKVHDRRERFEQRPSVQATKSFFNVDGFSMWRWRLAAAASIAGRVAKKNWKIQAAIMVGHLIFADHKTGPWLRGVIKTQAARLRGTKVEVKVDVPTSAEVVQPKIEVSPEAEAVLAQPKFDTASARRKAVRAEKAAARKALEEQLAAAEAAKAAADAQAS